MVNVGDVAEAQLDLDLDARGRRLQPDYGSNHGQ
jgi:hypothetical protein